MNIINCNNMSKKYDSILFDIDGTLWNASLASARGWNKGLETLGLSERVTAKQMESAVGRPFEECVDLLLPGLRQKHTSLVEILNYYEKEAIQEYGGDFYQDALEGLKRLSKTYRVFIVSNCQDWYLETFLQYSGIRGSLTDYDCHGKSGKQKHEMIQDIIHKHSLENPVYIGDTYGDKRVARKSGVAFRYAAYGFGNNFSFNNFRDILKYFHMKEVKKRRKWDKAYEISQYF